MVVDCIIDILLGLVCFLFGWVWFWIVDKLRQLDARQSAVEESYTRFLENLKDLLMQKAVANEQARKEEQEAPKCKEVASEETDEHSEEDTRCHEPKD